MVTVERSPYKHMLENPGIQAWIREVERGSESFAAGAFRRLGNCCETMAISPQELAEMDEQEAIVFLRQLVIKLEDRDASDVTIRTYIKAVKSWWTFNDLEVTKKVGVKDTAGTYNNERVPTKEELQRILDVCSMRERLSVSLMSFCGFRPEVLGDFLGGWSRARRPKPSRTERRSHTYYVPLIDVGTRIHLSKGGGPFDLAIVKVQVVTADTA